MVPDAGRERDDASAQAPRHRAPRRRPRCPEIHQNGPHRRECLPGGHMPVLLLDPALRFWHVLAVDHQGTGIHIIASQLPHNPRLRPRDNHLSNRDFRIRLVEEAYPGTHGYGAPGDHRLHHREQHSQRGRGVLRHVPVRQRDLRFQLLAFDLGFEQPGAGLQAQRRCAAVYLSGEYFRHRFFEYLPFD